MRDIKSILEGIVSQGRQVGSGGSSFRDRSSSNDKSGLNIGASRAHSHEHAAKEASIDRAEKREDEVKKRNKEAKQRQKETMKMSKEETVTEAKHVFHVHLHADDMRQHKMVDDNTSEPVGAKPKGTKIKLSVPAADTRSARDKATRYAAKNFGASNVKKIEYKGLSEESVTEANIGPNVDTETIRGIHQRAHASISNPANKKLTYSHPGFADSIDNEYKARKELAKRGVKVDRPKHRAVIESNLDEAIKGWKNAASDIRKFRSAASDAKKSAVLVSLKKDGSESAMHDAKSYHASEEEARKKHDTITKLNPNRKIRHNLYVDDKKVATLGEETNTEKREKIKNVARMDDAEPTSENSTLGKTGQIKTKIVEEKPTMSVPNFGLPKSLIDAVRQIVEKKDEDDKDPKNMTGGKTAVDTDPETDDMQNEDDAAAKGKKFHTVPKTDKEKKLAALASPKDKITHKDVLVGRGVVKEEVEFSEEELARIADIAKSFPTEIDEAVKKSSAPTTATSAPIRGANQDQSGFGTKNSTADYTISDSKKMKVKEETKLSPEDFKSGARRAGTGSDDELKASMDRKRSGPGSRTIKKLDRAELLRRGTKNEEVEQTDIDEAKGYKSQKELARKEASYKKFNSPSALTAKQKRIEAHMAAQKANNDAFKEKSVKEEVEQVDEISKDTLQRYKHVASPQRRDPEVGEKRKAGINLALKKILGTNAKGEKPRVKATSEEVELDETVLHDRYIRSHGKKAGGSGNWAFTTKSSGTPEKHEMAWTKGSLGDAAKEAKKKLNVKQVYVMENSIIEVELDEGRGRPRKNPLPAGQAADVDDTHKHPMQQIEKISHSIEGREPHFEHKDGSKTKVSRHLARHMMVTHNSMKTTQEKDDFANKLHANRDSMRTAVSKHF